MNAKTPPAVISSNVVSMPRSGAAIPAAKRLCASLLAAWWLLAPEVARAGESRGEPRGGLDAVDAKSVRGWACQPGALGSALWIHLYATGTNGNGTCHDEGGHRVCYVGGGPARYDRAGLADTDCKGHREHGFEIPTPSHLLDGQEHRVYARAINIFGGANPTLPGSPRTFVSAPLGDIAQPLFAQPPIAADELPRFIAQPRCSGFVNVYDRPMIYSTHSATCPQYSTPTPWPVADFTHFSVPEPVAGYQRGASDTRYGSDAIQAHGTTIGVHHHPGSAGELGRAGLHTVALIHTWRTDPRHGPVTAVRPWRDTNRRRIRFEGWVRAPRGERVRAPDEKSDTAAYLSFVLLFNHATRLSTRLTVSVSIIDLGRCGEGFTTEKAKRDDQIIWDTGGGWNIPIVQSFIHPTSVLVTKVPGSHDTTCELFGAEGERYFGFDFSGDQLEDAVRRIQRRFPGWLPGQAGDYHLEHINVQNEVAVGGPRSRAWLSTTYRDVRVRLLDAN